MVIPPERAEDYDYYDYNLWQPFEHEVVQNPLAILDQRTLDSSADLSPFHTPYNGAIGGSNMLSANPRHRWCYFSRMRPDELLLFMGHKHPAGASYPGGKGAGVPHVSFWDPTVPADAPVRHSVETRVLAAFPKKGRPKL